MGSDSKIEQISDDQFQTSEIIEQQQATQWKDQFARKVLEVLNKIVIFCKGSSNDKENEYKWYNRVYKYLYLAFTLFSIWFTIWLYSLFTKESKCPFKTEAECFNIYIVSLRFSVKDWTNYIIYNAIIPIVHINNIIFKGVYPIVSCFCIFLQIYFFYLGDTQITYFNLMGAINLGHYIVLLILALTYGIMLLLHFSFKKSKKITFVVIAAIILAVFIFIAVDQRKCDSQWRKGINGQLQDSKQTCNIKAPSCLLLKGFALIDLQFLAGNCFFGEQYKQIYRKKLPENEKKRFVAFPSNLNLLSDDERGFVQMRKATFKTVKSFDTLEQAKKQRKYDIIFDTQEQRYHIDIVRNETAVKENKKLHEKINQASPPLVKNVIVICADSISKYETHLKLKKFVNWMKKDSKNESYAENEPLENKENIGAQSYQFYRYNSIGYSSLHNIFPIFYGYDMELINSTKFQDLKQVNKLSGWEGDYRFHHHLQSFKKLGYITAAASTWYYYLGVQTYGDDIKTLANVRLDHQTMSYNCDPNFYDENSVFAILKGPSACTKRCLYHNTLAQYAFQYSLDFFQKYRDEPKVLALSLLDGHDLLGGSVKYIDDPITKFFETLEKRGHLQETLVVILSDHGQHKGQQLSDHYHPMLMIRVPQKMNKEYRQKIRRNQQNLVSGFNIYHFLQTVALGKNYEHKQKGLLGDISYQKDCKAAGIPLKDYRVCICK